MAGTSARVLAGENDLARSVDELAVCTAIRPLQGNLFEISFRAPEIAGRAQPGEFAQIWVDTGPVPLLRRPFSFSRADSGSGAIAFYLAAIGEGSRRLQRFRPGDQARILGPLGQGFTLPERPGRSALVSGGLGAAPFPLLAERLQARGEELVWINGAATRSGLYPDDMVPRGIGEIVLLTEDGSRGQVGRVTAGLLPRLQGLDRVYACGPNQMLAAVAGQVAAAAPAPDVEVSIEAPMGCGFGTCLGCAIPLLGRGARDESLLGLCCRQGPVLPGAVIDWERLLQQPAHLG